jgi:hypothetical protein
MLLLSFSCLLLHLSHTSLEPLTSHPGTFSSQSPQTQNSPTPSDVLDFPTPTRFGATHSTFSFCSRPALHSRRSFGNGGKRPHALGTPQRQTTAPWDQRLRCRLARSTKSRCAVPAHPTPVVLPQAAFAPLLSIFLVMLPQLGMGR